jgi:hypothetical protein
MGEWAFFLVCSFRNDPDMRLSTTLGLRNQEWLERGRSVGSVLQE